MNWIIFIILKKIIKEEADTVKACRLIDDILEKPGLKDKEAEKKVLQVLENMDLTLEDLDDSEVVKEILSQAILGVT